MQLALAPSLTDRLDARSALEAEAAQPIPPLPSRVIESLVRDRIDALVPIIEGRLRAEIDVLPAETIWMPRAGKVGSYRPVTALSLIERVLLRALEVDLHSMVRPPNRSVEAFRTFQLAVLDGNPSHVVVADVTSFYHFVPHELLETRIVEMTAKPDTANAIRSALSALFSRARGLPQSFEPSNLLSELCIAPVERALLRRGVPTFRSNDDFTLGAPSWGDALRYLELLQDEVSRAGFDLNGEKSKILKTETYRSNLGLRDHIFAQAMSDVEAGAADIDPYTGEPTADPAVAVGDPVLVTAAMTAAFNTAITNQATRATGPSAGFEIRANREVIATALYYFTRIGSDAAVDACPQVVGLDPSFARQYAAYLRSIPEVDGGTRTASTASAVLSRFRGHVTPWVGTWLWSALLRADAVLDDGTVSTMTDFVQSTAPSVLRARAALILAVHGQIPSHALARLFDQTGDAGRPDLIVAASVLEPNNPSPAVLAMTETDPIWRVLFDYAVGRHGDYTWL